MNMNTTAKVTRPHHGAGGATELTDRAGMGKGYFGFVFLKVK